MYSTTKALETMTEQSRFELLGKKINYKSKRLRDSMIMNQI
jgi:hypothetical protein